MNACCFKIKHGVGAGEKELLRYTSSGVLTWKKGVCAKIHSRVELLYSALRKLHMQCQNQCRWCSEIMCSQDTQIFYGFNLKTKTSVATAAAGSTVNWGRVLVMWIKNPQVPQVCHFRLSAFSGVRFYFRAQNKFRFFIFYFWKSNEAPRNRKHWKGRTFNLIVSRTLFCIWDVGLEHFLCCLTLTSSGS